MDRLPVLYIETIDQIDNCDVKRLIGSLLAGMYYAEIGEDFEALGYTLDDTIWQRTILTHRFEPTSIIIQYERYDNLGLEMSYFEYEYTRFYKDNEVHHLSHPRRIILP